MSRSELASGQSAFKVFSAELLALANGWGKSYSIMAFVMAAFLLCWGSPVCADDYSFALKAYQKGNFERALELWTNLAERGDPRSQYRLSRMYQQGSGVEQDLYIAIGWSRKAAAKGHSGAQNFLGWRYFKGDGVAQNYTEAASWYVKAALQGNAKA